MGDKIFNKQCGTLTITVLPACWLLLILFSGGGLSAQDQDRIRAWPGNPHYLAWGDTPVFLLGAANYHSWTPISRPGEANFREQLDRLAGVINDIGSPHVMGLARCLPYDPMNQMHDGMVSRVLQPWVRLDDGRYDLERFEPEWEARLKEYLDLALALRIIVSLEIWDDWSITRGMGGEWDPGPEAAWNAHPFNARNNINYGSDVLPDTTRACEAWFYQTVTSHSGNRQVLELQKLYVSHLLGIISEYPNIIINISNESRATLEWSRFWAEYTGQRIPAGMMIGDMPSTNRRDGGGECEENFNPATLASDQHYQFVDIAQAVSRHEFTEPFQQAIEGGKRILGYREAMAGAGTERPLIVSKDYSSGPEAGDMILWSRFVAGAAAARFHRPLGSDPGTVIDFQHEAVRILGRFIAGVPFWQMSPGADLISSMPEGTGANILSDPGLHYIVQLVGGEENGRLILNLPPGNWSVQWIDPSTGGELAAGELNADAPEQELIIPVSGNHRIINLKRKSDPGSRQKACLRNSGW